MGTGPTGAQISQTWYTRASATLPPNLDAVGNQEIRTDCEGPFHFPKV